MKKVQMLDKMILIATKAHAGQFDKGGTPYILHPLTVMFLTESKDEEIQCIAIGHDLFEDTSVTAEQLREEGISERVIDGIYAMTKMPGQTVDEYKQQVFDNVDAMIVKRADLKHNSDIRRLKGVTEKDIARMGKYMLFYTQIEEKLAQKAN
jgi:guanosine-3',5'-bis(diphosphate) 3'-pyrophosphohydrolase